MRPYGHRLSLGRLTWGGPSERVSLSRPRDSFSCTGPSGLIGGPCAGVTLSPLSLQRILSELTINIQSY